MDKYLHTYVHTHFIPTYIHAYILMYIHTYLHTYIQALFLCVHSIPFNTYLHTFIYVYSYIYLHTPENIHANINTSTRTFLHTYIQLYNAYNVFRQPSHKFRVEECEKYERTSNWRKKEPIWRNLVPVLAQYRRHQSGAQPCARGAQPCAWFRPATFSMTNFYSFGHNFLISCPFYPILFPT